MHSTYTSSEDEEFIPIGYKPQSWKPQIQKDSSTPPELQYEHLLSTALDTLNKIKMPTQKFKLPLDVKKDAPLKTSINLIELSTHLKRDSDHLQKFIMNELLTSGSLNSEGRLFLKGKFSKNQIQEILRDYIEMFVICKSCYKLDETELIKKNKLIFVKCNSCLAERSVGGIIEGYKTERRSRFKD